MRTPVYLIDDDAVITDSFAPQLQRHYNLKCFNSAKEALTNLESEDISPIIVSDLQMPELDGMTFIEKVREKKKDAKIIVASGNIRRQDALKAVNLGVFGFLEKPFSNQELQKVISQALDMFRSERSRKTLLTNVTLMLDTYSQLSSVYYERIVLLENQSHDLDVNLFEDLDLQSRYLELISKENYLFQRLRSLQEEISST